ncbi:hypothetical protein MKAN_09200 [Mycobacterium kansasii ATCC 12478]|uniref:Uncharacterized protein n=1 Tax=Mycobacterium kansasii ATCC 12478 TaxID=557599 RepID=U5WYE0_MYCKA|nr:hypothetical protein MKAN_09200 [Mycobacterium kansasii ATCC 12478]
MGNPEFGVGDTADVPARLARRSGTKCVKVGH